MGEEEAGVILWEMRFIFTVSNTLDDGSNYIIVSNVVCDERNTVSMRNAVGKN